MTASAMREPLSIGIKRGEFRANDPSSKAADAVFETRREGALRSGNYRCGPCQYESTESPRLKKKTALQVHHLDDDHANNEPGNLGVYCSMCHSYHHIGCDAPTPGGSTGWASQLRVAYVPELSPEDLNSLQRAIGAAMTDADESALAAEMLNLLSVLAFPVRDAFGSFFAKDFAACFSRLDAQQYAVRHDAVGQLRLLFSPDILKVVGKEMIEDNTLLPVSAWGDFANGIRK